MSDAEARGQLDHLLDHYTAGSIQRLLADTLRVRGQAARAAGDGGEEERCRTAEAALFVLGLGIGAPFPSG